MKKLIVLSTLIKAFAAMLFAGFVVLYMVGGVLYAYFVDSAFDYTISFIHLLLSIGFSTLLALFWGICFSDVVIKKWRFFFRYLLFDFLALLLLATSFIVSSRVAIEWSILWLFVACVITLFSIVLALLREWYFRKTGEHYTELLKLYQSNHRLE